MVLTKRQILDDSGILFNLDDYYYNWLKLDFDDDDEVGVQFNDDGSIDLFEI